MPKPVITLLTDFGSLDPYVGIMKGVILGLCPGARIVDLTHEVAPYQIPQAAFLLHEAWPWFPKGSIHVVVVDPGVGTNRRAILTEADEHFFIGPDNGVFSLLSPTAIREIHAGVPASSTFHGRDIFAPAAARLANGFAPDQIGPLVDNPVRLGFPSGTVLHVDRFGNIITNLRLTPGMKIRVGSETIDRHARTYANDPKGQLFLIEGSHGYLEIALNQSSAAERLGIGIGAVLNVAD